MFIRRHTSLLSLLLIPLLASATPSTPDQDFIDNQNGTVLHKQTGLTWKRCAEGQTWQSNACSGSASLYTQTQALALRSNFAAKSNWRLPTIAELTSIVEREKHGPAINSSIFPNTPGAQFWSASTNATYASYVWFVHFLYGYSNYNVPTDTSHVRLVRGGPGLDSSGEFTPTSAFIDHGNGTVTQQATGLMWQRCAFGQTWTGSTCSGSGTVFSSYDSELNANNQLAGYGDWRLPSTNELQTILEYKSANPSVNTHIFPNTPASDWFGTASLYAYDTKLMWRLSFIDSRESSTETTSNVKVRLVRGKWEYPNAVYDDTSKLVTFQDVIYNQAHYFVQLQRQPNDLFTLKTALPLVESTHYLPTQYDLANDKLRIPRVQAFGANFKAVLKNVGNYTFGFEQVEAVQ